MKLKGLEHLSHVDQLTLRLKGGREVKGYLYGGRLSDDEMPEGFRRYDLREDDDDMGDISEIADFVLVNHYGTFITREQIDCKEGIPVTWWDWPYDPADPDAIF